MSNKIQLICFDCKYLNELNFNCEFDKSIIDADLKVCPNFIEVEYIK